MTLLRRATALVTMLVTLVLVLTESGFACSADAMPGMGAVVAHGGRAATRGATGAMPMAAMAGMAMPAATSHGDRTPAPAPCRFPWAPNGCRDMAPCAPAALAIVAVLPVAPAPAPLARVVARVSAPAAVDAAPEPPPPRA